MTELIKIILTHRKDGKWDVTRERKGEGESMSGCDTLEEALDYVKAHELEIKYLEEEEK